MLLRARRHLKPGGRILASTGNVAHFYMRSPSSRPLHLHRARAAGSDHVRLFTRSTFRRLFRLCSLQVLKERSCPIPFENLLPGWPRVTDALCWADMAFGRLWPSLFAYQTVLEAVPDEQAPTDLLRQAQISAPYAEWGAEQPETEHAVTGR